MTKKQRYDIDILLVEDEAITAVMLQKALSEYGYKVRKPAATGNEAIQQVKEKKPDIILLDINLPGDIDGIDTAHVIFSNHKIPIIFMTGYSNQMTMARSKFLHPLAYLIKPVTVDEIDEVIVSNLKIQDAK
jgi:CheY-like chemotaxis protein